MHKRIVRCNNVQSKARHSRYKRVVAGREPSPSQLLRHAFSQRQGPGLKAMQPLPKMPPEIWRFCAGPGTSYALLPRPHGARAALRRRLSPPRAQHLRPALFSGVAARLRILIVTDAWRPQVNGVVRTLEALGEDLTQLGHQVHYLTPQGRISLGLPTYREIRLALAPKGVLEKEIRAFAPDAVHIATEGTLGHAARAICLKYGIEFSTSFHTRFPDYVKARFPLVPEEWVWRWLRWFHGPATAMMVATERLKREMAAHGFHNLRIWSRGVDVDHFRPLEGARLPFSSPIFLYVGRVAVEKNIEQFLALDLPGTKVVVGDGPARHSLEKKYPAARFLGARSGTALVETYAGSDVFVFPSHTDTFGLVLLEALACGLPVAAYPVQGPVDVVGPDIPGATQVAALDDDLQAACLKALALAQSPGTVTPRDFALERSWRACTLQFLRNIVAEPDL